jgi:hypothetical protein
MTTKYYLTKFNIMHIILEVSTLWSIIMDFYSSMFRNNNYNRQRAVQYANQYALTPNPSYRFFASHGEGGGDCTNFVSQCLLAGGAPMAFDSVRPWWYNKKKTTNNRDDLWSNSWSVANSLYWCLKVRAKNNMHGLKGTEVEDMSLLELGDIIQYENLKGNIYHSAIVTEFILQKGMRVPLISQHTYNALNISHIKPAAKKAHFMKISI